MGRIQDLLTPEWIDARVSAVKAWRASHPAGPDAADGGDAAERRLRVLVLQTVRLCELEYAGGADARTIRQHCREACTRAIPDLHALDFSIRHRRIEDGVSPSTARSLAERHGGTWWKATGQYAGVEYSFRNSPLSGETRVQLWYLAALTGDAELARSVAKPYSIDINAVVDPLEVREGILRCALAGGVEGEAILSARLVPGYSADVPPQLIELPLGVSRRDPATMLEAVRKLGTRFKGKWDPKRHRVWYDRRTPGDPRRTHPDGTWEQCIERTRDALFDYHWVFSWWAVAWLHVARTRGLDEILDPGRRKAYSEWVPFTLVDPGSP